MCDFSTDLGYKLEVGSCNTNICPIEGLWASWQPWGDCSATCGGGLRRRTRSCIGPFHGGYECGDDNYEVQRCSEENCEYLYCKSGSNIRSGHFISTGPESRKKGKELLPEVAYTEADRRTSAQAIGGSAIILLAIMGTIFLLMDLTSLRRHLGYMKRNLRSRFFDENCME